MYAWMKSRRWTTVVCLAAMMSLAVACGDDDNGGGSSNNANNANNVNNVNNDNNGADAGPDAAPEEDAGPDAEPEEDAGPDAEQPAEPLSGFDSADDGTLDESATGWSVLTNNTDGDRLLSLELAADGGASDTGTFEFEDFTTTEPANVLIGAAGCTEDSCESFFQAVSGTMEITTFEKTEGGSFEATLTDVELVEVELTQGGTNVIEDGNTWTIDDSTIVATVDPMAEFESSCEIEGFTADQDGVTATAADGYYTVEATTVADDDSETILSLQVYEDFGEEGEVASTEGTFQIDDYNYETCANCLLIYENCTDEEGCETIYSAGAGTLEVTSTGGEGDQFVATLTDAELAEVTIAQSYDTDLVNDGVGWCIDEFSWDVTIEAEEAAE